MALEQLEAVLAEKFDDIACVPLTHEEQVQLRNAIFTLKPKARLKQALEIIKKTEPAKLSIKKTGITLDIKKLTVFTQRYLQKFCYVTAKQPMPSNKAPGSDDVKEEKKEDDTPKPKEFKGITMASGMKKGMNYEKVGLVKDEEKEAPKKEIVKTPYMIETEYVEKITTAMGSASQNYWKILSRELKTGKFDRVLKLLLEVVNRTKKLLPEKEHSNIDDTINLPILKNAIEHNAMTGELFMALFNTIHIRLKSMHPPALDGPWDAWRDTIEDELRTGKCAWHELLPKCINQFLVKLDSLEDMIKRCREAVGMAEKPKNVPSLT